MEQQKGVANDADSARSSRAAASREHSESTNFSDDSVFHDRSRDLAALGMQSPSPGPLAAGGPYCDTLWSQSATTQLQPAFSKIQGGLVQRPGAMSRGGFSSGGQLPPEIDYSGSSSMSQFSSGGQGSFQAAKLQHTWRKCDDRLVEPGDYLAGYRVMAAKVAGMQDVVVPGGMAAAQIGDGGGIFHVGNDVDVEARPPAEKRLRSMMQLNEAHELVECQQEGKHDLLLAPNASLVQSAAGSRSPFHYVNDSVLMRTQSRGRLDESAAFVDTHKDAAMERYGVPPEAPPPVLQCTNLSLPEIERHQWISSLSTEQAESGRTMPAAAQLGVRGLGSLVGTRELNTMEQLLVQCASALEANDATYAQQIIFVINNIASLDGDPNQRLLGYFLRALILRASRFTPHMLPGHEGPLKCSKLKTVLELTNYVDVMPWYRFGFIAANGAILEAFEGKDKVHILDFNTSHCMQWPTLIEALAERSEGPPQVRLTVCVAKSPVPPQLDVPYDELIIKLAKFARLKNVPFEYQLLSQDCENLEPSMIDVRDGEVLAVNCLFRLHYVADVDCGGGGGADAGSSSSSRGSPRDDVLRFIRNLNPAIITVTEEDANLTSPKLVSRLKAAFNYLWIPFDALHTLLPKESEQRVHYEGEVAHKIENIIACEGRQRVERVETKDRWVQRMRKARFEMISFNDDVVAENKHMLGEHSGCWGLRKDDDEDVLFLTWKGHNVSFSTVWVPADPAGVLR